MIGKLSSCQYSYVNPSISNSLQSSAIVGRIFQPNLLELACDSIIDLLATPQDVHFDAFAKACIVENIFDYIRCLCAPSLPLTVTELCTRVYVGLPSKLKPGKFTSNNY